MRHYGRVWSGDETVPATSRRKVSAGIQIYHPGPDSHLFISADVLDMLKSQIDDLIDKISVPIVEGKEGLKN